MGVWSMKRKRNPVGEIVKYKARFCAHGGQTQEDVHYTNTFAPVVTWTTIQFLLILSQVHGWHTRQIDFVLAYPQAKVSHDLYMLVPDKFKVQDNKLVMDQDPPPPWKQRYKMKLIQNLYGLKDAGQHGLITSSKVCSTQTSSKVTSIHVCSTRKISY